MVRYIALSSLLAISSSAAALDPAVSGLWYNPAQNGHGFEITVVAPGTATVTWYTFSPFRGPIWVAGVLTEQSPGVLSGPVDYYDGMRFGTFVPSESVRFPWGTISVALAPNSCDQATLSYNGTLTYQSGEGFGSGTIPIVKLAGVDGLVCGGDSAGDQDIAGVYSGQFTSAATGGGPITMYAGVMPDRSFLAVAPGRAIYEGTISGTTSISIPLTAIPVPGTTFSGGNTFNATGSARAQDFISGSYSGSGDSGQVSLYWLGASTRAITRSALAGSYVDGTNSTGFTGSLSSAGAFSGRDNLGCQYSGTLPAQLSNPFRLTVQVSGCSVAGTYAGMAMVFDWGRAGDSRAIVLGLRGGAGALATVIRR